MSGFMKTVLKTESSLYLFIYLRFAFHMAAAYKSYLDGNVGNFSQHVSCMDLFYLIHYRHAPSFSIGVGFSPAVSAVNPRRNHKICVL